MNLETETTRLYDELLDLAVVSGATGEVLFNSFVLQEAMTQASKSLLSGVSDIDTQHCETVERGSSWNETMHIGQEAARTNSD